MSDVLNLQTQPLDNGLFVEASAGTGKTFTVAALIVRALATDESLSISEILVTTFTRNAAAELRDRVRRRLVHTAKALRDGNNPDGDAIVEMLQRGSTFDIRESINRITRAIIEFDTATISTIHSVCTKIIALAGETTALAGEDDQARIIAEVVNDALVAQSTRTPVIDEELLVAVVAKKIGEPLTGMWIDTQVATDSELVQRLQKLVAHCVSQVEEKLEEHPSFDFLIRRAHTLVHGGKAATALREFRRKYRYLIVDEAQDTDSQQWEIFRGIFPIEGEQATGTLIAVGDPKQSIYKFRGADIDAYTRERAKGVVRTLRTNYRSDGPVIDGLNALFDGATFGEDISYVNVNVPKDNHESAVVGVEPVEVVTLSEVTNNSDLADAASSRVAQLLNGTTLLHGNPIVPKDIVVLVKSGAVGSRVERNLRRLSIPAVSTGTASVMQSETAEHFRVLLRALERFADASRVRHVLGTPFFGVPLTSRAILDDNFISHIQEQLSDWATILRRSGVAALSATVLSDADTIAMLSAGLGGERRLTDFSHLTDLLFAETGGAGCSPTQALEALAELHLVNPTSETVSRRVESDSDAVQIMTIHVAKGLEFPVVVVADLWHGALFNGGNEVPVFRLRQEDNQVVSGRVVDIGWVIGAESPIGGVRRLEEACEEYSRLLYVAATRAKHHVSILHALDVSDSIVPQLFDADALAGKNSSVTVVDGATLPTARSYKAPEIAASTHAPGTATMPEAVIQTYRRTSFTGITDKQKGDSSHAHMETQSGGEEGERIFSRVTGYAAASVEFGVPAMPLARIPGGTHIGKILHSVYELIDPAHPDLHEHVHAVVKRFVTGDLYTTHGASIVDGVVLSLTTPLGSRLSDVTLQALGVPHRAAEMSFEMSLAHLRSGVTVQHVGKLLQRVLPADDLLMPYAHTLSHHSFNIPLAGLINGSIDALLRVSINGSDQFFISDYKSNRLDREGDDLLTNAYSQDRMLVEMEHHHYPLQALIYGAAIYRFLRWRAPHLDANAAIGGFAYMFIRGMTGPETPADESGRRNGVLTWSPPVGFWSQLSDLFAGKIS